MSVLEVAAVRQRVAAAVEALVSPAAWRESRLNFEMFPGDPRPDAHLSFAIAVPQTDLGELEGSRRRLAVGAAAETRLVVRWLYVVKAETAVASTDAALGAESTLTKALLAMSHTDLHLSVTGHRRRFVGDGTWLLTETAVTILHRVALQ